MNEDRSSWTGHERWAQARSLLDLGEVTAAWLNGDIEFHPYCWAKGPDEETADLTPVLCAVNRAGYVTDFSQPGEVGVSWRGTPRRQRAAIGGWCGDEVAERLELLGGASDLAVLVLAAGRSSDLQMCVTTDDGRPSTWAGLHDGTAADLHPYEPYLSHMAYSAMAAAWQIEIVDPVWGRNDVLWPKLLNALGLR